MSESAEKIDIPMERILLAIEETTVLLKKRFPNLTVEETVRLASNLTRVAVRAFEGR